MSELKYFLKLFCGQLGFA